MTGADSKELVLQSMNGALKSRKFYPAGHPSIAASTRKTLQHINEALRDRNNLLIGLVNQSLILDDTPVVDAGKNYPDIIRHMENRSAEAIIFEKGVTENELSAFIDAFSADNDLPAQEIQKELSSQNVIHITLKSLPMGKRSLLEVYNDAVEVVINTMAEVRMGKIPRSEPVNNIINELDESVFSDPNAMIGLTMIKNYDNYLYNHSVNVSILSIALARAMKLDSQNLHIVGVSSLLHDIGKTGVSEQIIRKPGGLSSEEWEKIKEHPRLGSNIIRRMSGMDESTGRIIFEHHVKFDHSGYPETSSSLHPLSQIVTIADAYDALTTLRVYQQPRNPVEAIKVMMNLSGRHFDPKILKSFINMIGMYPVGTTVRLSTNEIGIVVKVDSVSSDTPVVKVLYDPSGNALEKPFEIDLSSKGPETPFIIATVDPALKNINIGEFFKNESS